MPLALPAPEAVNVTRKGNVDYGFLNRALRNAGKGAQSQNIYSAVIANIQQHREEISVPLDPDAVQRPSAEDNARFAGKKALALNIRLEGQDNVLPIALNEKEIEAVLYVAKELDINEIDAAILLEYARDDARHRTDKDVLRAAFVLHEVRRRESLLFLQEILRACLNQDASPEGSEFKLLMMKERDTLVTEHGIVGKIIKRVKDAMEVEQGKEGANKRNKLAGEEFVLIAEALFLLAYTVQFSRSDAPALRALIDVVCEVYLKEVESDKEQQQNRANQFGAQNLSSAPAMASEIKSERLLHLESIRNLLVLAWMVVLDRSRYEDKYDPRTGTSKINDLLTDEGFVRQTTNLPPFEDTFELTVTKLDKGVLAAEFVGAIFRLAVAVPDEDEAAITALRVCAYGGCLKYLADELPAWIREGAGSLCLDSALYGDVLEDLALDTAETHSLTTEFVRWHYTEISRIADNLMIDSFQQGNVVDSPRYGEPMELATSRATPQHRLSGTPSLFAGVHTPSSSLFGNTPGSNFKPTTPVSGFKPTTPSSPFQPMTPNTPHAPFTPRTPASSFRPTTPGSAPYTPATPATPAVGKPPLPPNRTPSVPPLSGLPSETPRPNNLLQLRGPTPKAEDQKEDPNAKYCLQNNLASQLARFVARSIPFASEAKHKKESVFKGPKYWTGMEGPAAGFIPKISEALYDLQEVSNRSHQTGGGVGTAFSELLTDFLLLLEASVGPNNHGHASQALRYLANAGDAMLSLNMLKRALDAHIQSLSQAHSSRGFGQVRQFQMDEAEAAVIAGMINVVTAAANNLKNQGGVNAIQANLGTELAGKISALAVFNVNPSFKASLVSALEALDDRRATTSFLRHSAENRAKSLNVINSQEAESGNFDVTAAVLKLANSVTRWEEEDYPADAIESIAINFAIDKVLHEWSRRRYATEFERWRIVKAAGSFLLAIGLRDSATDHRHRMLTVMSKLLAPAPGTGHASTALRSLFSACGLLRNCDSVNITSDNSVSSVSEYYKAWGQLLLTNTAKRGLGKAYREMEDTVMVCCRVMLGLFDLSPTETSVRGNMAPKLGDLIVMEKNSIVSIASLVFNLDSSLLAAYKAGYSDSACSLALSVLALAADCSQKIAVLLVMSDEHGVYPTASFRSSLARIIIERCISSNFAATVQNIDSAQPIMFSALRLVEACLGRDGGCRPGLYLLGLNLDSNGRYCNAEYGVLSALLDVMSDSTGFLGLLDNPARSTAAVFVQRLAANTVRKTSTAVLEYVKEYGELLEVTRGSGFGDEMLFRVLDFAGARSGRNADDDESWNWGTLTEFASACMSLSALQVRLYPECEKRRQTLAAEDDGFNESAAAVNGAPSPYELYRVVVQMIDGGALKEAVFEAFRQWYCLLGVRAVVDSSMRQYSAVPVFLEVAKMLLAALYNTDADNVEGELVRKDGGYVAASAVLSCVDYICGWQSQGISLGEVQVADLLLNLIQATSVLGGSTLDSSRARTVLYSGFLKVVPLARKTVSEEGIARAFGGRVGPRQVSGTEGMLTVCCEDAINSTSPATKAVSMAAICDIVLMDPTRAIPSLNSQSRLRRIVQVGIAEPEVRSLIAKGCSRTNLEINSSDPFMAKERAAKIVCDAAMSLIHAVSTAPNGTRAVVDSGCMDALASLLHTLENSRMSRFAVDDHRMELMNSVNEYDGMDVEEGRTMAFGTGERRSAMAGAIASAVSAAISFPDSVLVEGAFDVLDKGRGCFTDALRSFRTGRPAYLEAIGAMAVILSRIPGHLFSESSGPYQLRFALAGTLQVFVSANSGSTPESSITNLGIGFLPRKPLTQEELVRARKDHPIGGSVFDRDVAAERISCLHSIMAALRSTSGSLHFEPTLGGTKSTEAGAALGERVYEQGESAREPAGNLTDVFRVCKAAMVDIRRFADESVQAKTVAEGDALSSVSNMKRKELIDLCEVKYGLVMSEDTNALNAAIIECVEKEAEEMRRLANQCISIFEGALFLLRDYVRYAKSAALGQSLVEVREARGGAGGSERVTRPPLMSAATGHALIEEAREVLLPLCKEVDSIGMAMWGSKDASFCKQLSRQIRSCVLR